METRAGVPPEPFLALRQGAASEARASFRRLASVSVGLSALGHGGRCCWGVYLDAPRLVPPALQQPVAGTHRQVRELACTRCQFLRGRKQRITRDIVVRPHGIAPLVAQGLEEVGCERARLAVRHPEEELPARVPEEVRPEGGREEDRKSVV